MCPSVDPTVIVVIVVARIFQFCVITNRNVTSKFFSLSVFLAVCYWNYLVTINKN